MNNAESYKLRFDMKEIKFLGWVGILLFGLFFAACSDDAADKEWDGGTGSLLVAPEVVSYAGSGQTIDEEDKITDMRACLFEGGVLTQIFEDLSPVGGIYNLPVTADEGTLYMLANTGGIFDMDAMKGCRESEWLKETLPLKDGKPVHFFTGKLELGAQTQGEQTLSLKRGIVRFDLSVSGNLAVNSLTLKNAAQSVYLFSQEGNVESPEGVDRSDVTVHFDDALKASVSGVLYVYEQENDGLEVSVEAVVDGNSKTLTKRLEEKALKRNTVYTLALRKDASSDNGVTLDILDWEDGGDASLHPDLDATITVNKDLSSLPEGVQVLTSGNVLSVPSRGMDFTLALHCDDELEFESSQNSLITVEPVASGTIGENKFIIHKGLLPPGYAEEEVKVFFRRKGLKEAYEEDCITFVLEENPIRLEGFTFDSQNYTCDFGRYIDNEMGRFILPAGMELIVRFDGEDPWVKVEEVADGVNTYRVLGGWKPNDPKADGRKQSARLIVRRIADQQETETYTVIRRNYGLPVTYLNGIWWCRYNALGNSKDFEDQVLSAEDPARLAGKTVQDYLNTCSQEEYLYLWNAAYEGNDGVALKAIYKDSKITLDGWRSGESEHINQQEPSALAPDGYEMPTFNDYRSIFGAFVIPTAWTEFTPQIGGTAYRSAIILEKRSGLQLDGQDLGELWSFSVQSVKNQGEEPLTFYGVGCQWDGSGVNRNWFLLACYNPNVTGWLVKGSNASLEHNGAGANNTRIVRFKKSDVEYIYQ